MKSSKKKQEKQRTFVVDPYSHYYDVFENDTDDDELRLDGRISDIKADPEKLAAYFESQLEEAKKTKKEWVFEAMKKDPAFMADPIKDYYSMLIPPEWKTRLTAEQYEEIIAIFDPVTWAQKYLYQKHGGWKPRHSKDGKPYQSQMIRCKSKRIVARAGRRLGKSISLIVRILHRAFTWSPSETKSVFNVIIFTPNQAQIDLLFKMMEVLIDGNPKLMQMVVNGRVPTRKSPFYQLDLTNGVCVKGFVSGSAAIRGQASDMLVLDEGSFLTKEDTDAVVSLMAENKQAECWISSTPKGLKDWFYERVHDPDFVSFYFPSDEYHPDWDAQMENEFRKQLTSAGYEHEIRGNFSADGEGVFQHPFIEAARSDYDYTDCTHQDGWIYGMGIDWNSAGVGTQIKVVGYDITAKRYKIVDSASVNIDGWTQTAAVKKARELNRKWKGCSFIYVDDGYGAMQIEALHEIGMKAPKGSLDKNLLRAKPVNFSVKIEVYDPWKKKKVAKPTKPFMVNNAVRVFENYLIDIPEDDFMLTRQLEGYVIDHITPSNVPVYAKDSQYGDHALDALMLALMGFTLELSSVGKPKIITDGNHVDSIFKNNNESTGIIDTVQKERDAALLRDKNNEKRILEESGGRVLGPPSTIGTPAFGAVVGSNGASPVSRQILPARTFFGARRTNITRGVF